MLAGIDLGGTQVRVALARSDGRLIASFKTKTPLLRTPQRMVLMDELILEMMELNFRP